MLRILVAIGALVSVASTAAAGGPVAASRIDSTTPRRIPFGTPRADWNQPPTGAGLRGAPIPIYDNGEPLNDVRDPASQLSEMPPDPLWEFDSAAADDFTLPTGSNPGDGWTITTVRCAFTFFQEGFEDATPSNTWNTVMVTIYPDVAGEPGGEPNGTGGHIGAVVATQEIPVEFITEIGITGQCRVGYVVDIPVTMVVSESTKYWLSIVPRYPAPPQTAWCLSVINTDSNAKQGFPGFGIPYWTEIEGNFDHPLCTTPDPPIQASIKNVSFQLYGNEGLPVSGACCDEPSETCTDGVFESNCLGVGKRWAANETCASIDPPCTAATGACCLSGGSCQDLAPNACLSAGGDWTAGDCGSFTCPPANDACLGKITLNGASVSVPFDSTAAITEASAPTTNCGQIEKDLWYNYEATCTGTVTVSTIGSSFDTVLAVYGPAAGGCPNTGQCPADSPGGDNTETECNDNASGSETGSYISVPVASGDCLKIRVGGKTTGPGGGGVGVLLIDCVPNGSGACCHPDDTCEILDSAACDTLSGDVFTVGESCDGVACPVEPLCCQGDANSDCVVDELDVPGFVDWLLTPPADGSPEECRADTNGDGEVDGLDIAQFTIRVIAETSCAVACCPGDMNGDNALDGLDIQGLLDVLLSVNLPACDTIEFCHADVNGDHVINEVDAEAFSTLLMSGASCPIP